MPHVQLPSSTDDNFAQQPLLPQKQQFLEDSPFCRWLSAGESKLPPEVERDNVEYKWKLVGMTAERRIHLITQMRWRVGELGYCWYIIGVKDNGDLEGLKESDFHATMDVLREIVRRANLIITQCQMFSIIKSNHQERFIGQIRIELEASEHLKGLEIRVDEQRAIVLGASGTGKTTLLSVLSDWGHLDDGKGKMRTRLLHHRHELLSGSTSSITHQPLVFTVTSNDNNKVPLALCADDSLLLHLERRREILGEGRVLQMVDSAGKLRFDRTVFSVLTTVSTGSQTALLLLDSTEPAVPSTSVETFRFLRALALPTAIVVSKIDQSSTEAITNLLESFGQLIGEPLKIYSEEEQQQQQQQEGLPVILVSAVSGDYLDTLSHFLYNRFERDSVNNNSSFFYAQEYASAAFIIEQVVSIESVGTVVYGQVAFGNVNVGDEMLLGPQETNQISNINNSNNNSSSSIIRIKSIQRLKCPVNSAHFSQHVSLALDCKSANICIKKGMALLLPKPQNPSKLSLKPLRRIIAEMDQISGSLQQRRHFNGVIYVMGQRFSAVLDVQVKVNQSLSSTSTTSNNSRRLVCLVSFPEKSPACVFLFPSAPIIFIGDGRREKFAGKVLDYFALAKKPNQSCKFCK